MKQTTVWPQFSGVPMKHACNVIVAIVFLGS